MLPYFDENFLGDLLCLRLIVEYLQAEAQNSRGDVVVEACESRRITLLGEQHQALESFSIDYGHRFHRSAPGPTTC